MEIKISILNESNTELSTYVTDLDSYELSKKHNILIEKSIDEMIHKLHFEQENKNTITEIPNPAEFMNLGEDAFNKNIHKKLRETLSQTEKQMWINGYLLALTQQKIYSEEEAMEFFIEGYTQRAIAPNARMYAIQLFKELKNK